MVNSLFYSIDIYSDKNIEKIIVMIEESLENFDTKKEKETFSTIAKELEEWLKILKNDNISFKPEMSFFVKKENYLPLFKIIHCLYFSNVVSSEQVKNDGSFIGSLYRAVIYNDLHFFAFIMQRNYYKISTLIENESITTLEKIPILIQIIREDPCTVQSIFLTEDFRSSKFVSKANIQRDKALVKPKFNYSILIHLGLAMIALFLLYKLFL
jgi:hypothetical protein